jgi:pimeloyl-ACP methyl ester carboxylesterase
MTSLLSIERLTPDNSPFPAYFVASTAPVNVEDRQADRISDPKSSIDEISQHLQKHKGNAEILIVIHGYNTSSAGVRNWFESIGQHLVIHHSKSRPKGSILIGYRWPSEQIFPLPSEGQEKDSSFSDKYKSARKALPVILGKMSRWGTIGLVGGMVGILASLVATALQVPNAVTFLVIFSALTILSLVAVSPIFTLLILRLVGYFRDNYRASNFGVADLVELIRQIDSSLIKNSPGKGSSERADYWKNNRIKLSFIGHSMGAFVVTNAVRILSDVFDPNSVGSIDAVNPEKKPSPAIGNVFSLGRLVLVSPDIPAETIVSGRANFLQSSLRRFEEAYLFSNEGDMALRLASTAANYFSYPSNTQDGGYRLGNVTVRNSKAQKSAGRPRKRVLQKGAAMQAESYGMIARLSNGQLVNLIDGREIPLPFKTYPLDYLYIREQVPLSERQKCIALAPYEKPIGELFTFFDCTDYSEKYQVNGQEKTVGLVSQARRKQALTFRDYICLTIDYFSGKIDTHGGYFSNGELDREKGLKPEAAFTKLAIYGLACLGFEKFLLELPEEPVFHDYQSSFDQILKDLASKPTALISDRQQKVALSQVFSSICRDKGIQVLLAQERYTKDVLEGLDRNTENNL